jgi:hypothetical protein
VKKGILLTIILLLVCSAVLVAGINFGMIDAVKSQVRQLDKKVLSQGDITMSVWVTGIVAKGAVNGANVKFYALNDGGTEGGLLGSTVTDTDGSYTMTVELSSAVGRNILAEASGGSYINEVSGDTETLTGSDIMKAVFPTGTTRVAITPLTNMAAFRAVPMMVSGIDAAIAVGASNAGVAQQYNQPDILGIFPVDASNASMVAEASREQRNYGIILAGIAQEAAALDVRPIDLSEALAIDMDDGVLDGLGADPIPIPTISGPVINLPADAGVSDLQNAIDIFIGSGNNVTNLVGLNISNTPVNINPAGGSFYIEATALPAWIEGQGGSASLSAKGGTPPYTWTVTGGSSLPGWMSLNNGVLSGTAPILAGGSTMSISPPFSLTCTDSTGLAQAISLTVTIIKAPPTLLLGAGAGLVVGQAASFQLASATGGVSPYSFTATGVPPGMTLNPLTGYLTGTPTQAGMYTVSVSVRDQVGAVETKATTVTVSEAPQIPPPPPGTGTYGGTWVGTFNYTAQVPPVPPETEIQYIDETFTLTITLEVLVSIFDQEVLFVTSASCTDPTFGATSSVVPSSPTSTATLSTVFGSTSGSGEGIYVSFPNGSTIFTVNNEGALAVSSDGNTLSSTEAFAGDAFSASSSIPDSNIPGSGPGGYAYNWCYFTSWSFVRQ